MNNNESGIARRLAPWLAAAACAAALPAGAADDAAAREPVRQISVAVRDQYQLNIPDALERVVVVDPAVADVVLEKGTRDRKGSVLVVGKKPGTTMVSVWQRGAAAPQAYLVRVTGDLATLMPDGDGARTQVYGDSAVLGGSAPSLLAHRQSLAAAEDSVGQGKVFDNSTIDAGGVVQVDVKVVEFSKQTLKDAGFNFSASNRHGSFSFGLASQLAPAGKAFDLTLGLARGNFLLDTNLRLLETNGLARVLAEPTLVALSGQSAKFLAGGELPVPQAGGLGTTTVTYKPFGIGLTLTPTVLAKDRIALKVAPEASDLDYTNGITVNNIQIPAIITRRADTTVELGDGESYVIGGLVSRNTVSSVNKLPLLGDLPIIGTFFRSMEYSQNDKELLIVVTPHLVRPLARGVTLPLPGQEEKPDTPANAWGHFLMGVASGDQVPGFSK
ncbi:pilus assembly protein N-terminal domain-containing protein [Pigmentiphaga soli]|uniref:Pilus assembly protein N-terminal domain-containing protein n=1 Tax=Pigmentiphaga soli TaxID=1007095 RepID=A0ABP8H580_9BURK